MLQFGGEAINTYISKGERLSFAYRLISMGAETGYRKMQNCRDRILSSGSVTLNATEQRIVFPEYGWQVFQLRLTGWNTADGNKVYLGIQIDLNGTGAYDAGIGAYATHMQYAYSGAPTTPAQWPSNQLDYTSALMVVSSVQTGWTAGEGIQAVVDLQRVDDYLNNCFLYRGSNYYGAPAANTGLYSGAGESTSGMIFRGLRIVALNSSNVVQPLAKGAYTLIGKS